MIADNFMWFPDSSAQKGAQESGGQGDEVDVEGETTDGWFKRKKAFEITSFGFSLKQSDASVVQGSGGPAAGGKKGGASDGGRAKFQEFTVDKFVDLASVSLYKACSLGTKFSTVMLAVRKAGGSNLLYVQYMFREVSVTGITWGGGGGTTLPTEKVTLEFEAMGFQYVQQQADGTQGKKLLWSWNSKGNRPGLAVEGFPPAPPFLLTSQA